MFVVARGAGDEIVVEPEIRITVLAVQGRVARIGVEAPRSVPVLRQELLEQSTLSETTSQDAEASIMAGVIRVAR